MDYTIILRLFIGAFIGYVTNWIAVTMLFKPAKPIMIGKFKLPFTPGIIPNNKDRIAASIGDAISRELLNEETLKQKLLSEEVEDIVKQKVIDFLNETTENQYEVESVICEYIDKETYDKTFDDIVEKISSNIYEKLINSNIGGIVEDNINAQIEEKMKGKIIGLLGGKAIATTISRDVASGIEQYIEENGKELISKMVEKELESYTKDSVGAFTTKIGLSSFDLVSFIMNVYEKVIIQKIHKILVTINISEIVQNKIGEMDVLEFEILIKKIMKKELNALIYLGAVIGFLLGLLNLLF